MKKNKYKPTIYCKDIFSINYEKLKKSNITHILFDIDNTIAATNENKPSKEIQDLIKKLKEDKFTIIILTNALPKRAKTFASILDVEFYSFACKPFSYKYKKIINKYKLNINNIVAVGDQLFTDIKGANKLGIKSILVNQISKRESIITKINRLKENYLIKKENIIKRGDYYE